MKERLVLVKESSSTMQKRNMIFNPLFSFILELSLVDRVSINLVKVKLKDDLPDSRFETSERHYPIVEQFTIKDLMNFRQDTEEIFKGKGITLGLAKFQYFSMFLKGEAKTNWKTQEDRVVKQQVLHPTNKNKDRSPVITNCRYSIALFILLYKEFLKCYVKYDSVRNQKAYMRYLLEAYNKLSLNQRKTCLYQMNNLIPGLIICTNCTKLPEYELKDIFY